MKKIFLFLFFFVTVLAAKAQLNAYFSHCEFNSPSGKSYVETYLSVMGNSVSFKKNAKGKYQGSVEVGILFSQNGEIKASKKYNLLSPEVEDTSGRPNFIDQQRFPLDAGEYEMEIMISDKNINGKLFSIKEKININFPSDKVSISGIQLLSSFTKAETQSSLTKNGFDLVPYASDFFPENINELSFYAEVYNTKTALGADEKFLLSYYIASHETKARMSKYIQSKKETTNVVNILLSKFTITDLPSGNYDLVVEVRNKNNEIAAQKSVLFQRKNPKAKIDILDLSSILVDNTFASKINSKDSLSEYIRSLRPIASLAEKNFLDNQLKLAEPKLMQQFLYNFWQTRNPLSPAESWSNYNDNVMAVNKKFGSFTHKGYEADRGRVYLQYGTPDKREEYPNEPTAYPYEIWIYYKLNDKSKLNPGQTNKKFIFYNSDLVTNNYQLLHSDALSETNDSRWEMKLHKRTVQSHDFEKKDAPSHYGGHSSDEFNNPK